MSCMNMNTFLASFRCS